jgi:Polyketide cyclase / dehydrase and lipid transport
MDRRAWTFWAMAAFLLADRGHAATETAIRSIDIAQDSDAYVANVVMFAPVATDVAWQVLTDFDHMAKWVPNVRESKVIAREANAVTIEQDGVAKFGILSFSYVSVRHIEPDPLRTIRSTQIKGNMRRLESLMTLAPDGNGTKLVYHLEMVSGRARGNRYVERIPRTRAARAIRRHHRGDGASQSVGVNRMVIGLARRIQWG